MALTSSPEERGQGSEASQDVSGPHAWPGRPDFAAEDLAQPTAADKAPTVASERSKAAGRFEPTVGEHLRLGQFVAAIDRAELGELRDLAKRLAQMSLLVYPAMLRGLAHEAAENLMGRPWAESRGEELVAELTGRVKGASRLPEDERS